MQILILGGTAFTGIHMTHLALERGHRVTLFNRGNVKIEWPPEVETLKGDRDGKLAALMGRTWDAVIDNSGYVPRHVKLTSELLASNVDHYLFVSTISVYADLSRANDEDSPLARVENEQREDWTNAYGALKALCERAAAASAPGRTTMVRPGLIVGPGDPTDRFIYWPARAARGGEMLAPGNPAASFQLIDVRDLACFCLDVLEQRHTGVFNVTSPPGMFRTGDIVNESVASAGQLVNPNPPPRPRWVSEETLVEQGVEPFSELPGWVPECGALGGLHRTRVDRALDVGLRISPLAKTVGDTLAWHLTRPGAPEATLRAGPSAQREGALLALWETGSGKSAQRAECLGE